MIPRLFKPDATDFNAVGYGPITTTIRATVTEELNQAPVLEMELLVTDPLLDTIIVGSIIAAKPNAVDPVQAFVVEEITKPLDGVIRIYAPHIAQHRTQLLAIPVLRITSLGTLLERLSGNFFADNPFTFTLGRTGMAKPFYMTEPHSLRDIMGMIIENYGGEWGYDNFTCTLYMKRGRESGARVLYGRNMSDFNLDEFFDFENSVTGCYGWAKYEDSGSEVLITARGPYYSDDAWQFPYTKTAVVDFSDEIAESSTKDQATVEALAQAWIKNKGAIGTTAEVAFNHIDGGEDIGMGDTIRIYNNVYNYEARSRVVGLRYDVIAETYESVTIGEQRTTLSEAIQDTAGGSYSYSGGGGGASVDPSTTLPIMDGTASVGTEQTYARGDHVHPTDTSRAAKTDLTVNKINPSDKWIIPDNTDWNTIKTLGTWFVRDNNSKATMTQSPVTEYAGTLTVSTPMNNNNIGEEISGAWKYIMQEYVTYNGEVYRRSNHTNGNGTWNYENWSYAYTVKPAYAQDYSTDFNNIKQVGIFCTNGVAMTNAPPFYQWAFLEVKRSFADGYIQEVYDPTHRYQRMYTGNPLTWTDWHPTQFVDQTIIKSSVGLRHTHSADVTTTSTVSLTTGTLNKKYYNTQLLCFMGGNYYPDRYTAQLLCYIDGTEQYRIITTNANKSNSGVFVLSNIGAGSHNIDLRLGAQSGATAYAPAYNVQYLTIIEI